MTMTRPIALAASFLLAAGSSLAQEQARPAAEPNAPRAARPEPEDREALKARLERRQDETRQSLTRIERALKMLDEGQPTDRVREEASMRRGNGGSRSRGPDGAPQPPHPPTREALAAFLLEHNPELASRLDELKVSNPEMADRILSRIEPHFREIAAERDAEMKELRTQNLRLGWEIMGAARELGQALRADPAGAAADQTRATLRALLANQFDLQVKLHKREIMLLEERVARLRQEMEQQSTDREKYVADKIEQMESWSKRAIQRERERHEQQGDRPAAPPTPKN